MARFTVGTNIAVDMTKLSASDLIDGDVIEQTSTSLVVNTGDGFIERFSGNGFTYDAEGTPTGGTITSFVETLNGSTAFTITEINYSAAQFYQQASTGDTAGTLGQIFAGDDNFVGGNLDDGLTGFAGHDNLSGGSGTDSLAGGDGADHLWGQSVTGGSDGADLILGGAGGDYIHGNAGSDTLDGGADSDRINGGADNDTITGGSGADRINGNRGNDVIDAGSDDDDVRGGQDNDAISGGQGFDVLSGDLGADTLVGGSGLDLLTGGEGNDVFRFASGDSAFATSGTYAYVTDVVADFTNGQDLLDFGKRIEDVFDAPETAFASVQAAYEYARVEFADADEPPVSAVEAQVGNDVYIFYNAGEGPEIDSAIRLVNFQIANFDTEDFVTVG